MIRTAIYIRVSTDEQVMHGLSLEAQKTALTEYAKNNGMHIVDYYADEGITAIKKLKNRKEFQRLLSDVQQDKIDIILVTKLDRWFRNIKDYHNTQEILEKHNCNWKTIFENYDTSTAAGRLHINIMLSVNQDECDRTSERIKAVFKHKLENKEIVSGSLPVGYAKENKHLIIDEEKAPMIQDIYNYYELNNSVRKTTIYVNQKYGVMYDFAVRRILTDTIYKGEHKSGIKDFCPAIISENQFDKVQELLKIDQKQYKQIGDKSTYIFSGMLKCKFCGRKMSAGRRKVGGKAYKQYRCPYHAQGNICKNQYVIPEKGGVEKYLLSHVKEELQQYKISIEMTNKKTEIKDNTAQIAKIKKKIAKLKDLYLDDLIDKDTYKQDYENYTIQIQEMQAQDTAVKADISALNTVMGFDLDNIYNTLTDTEKRYLWQSIIEYIEVGQSKEDITIHFK